MSKELTRSAALLPSVFDDFFRPWNNWLDNGLLGRMLTTPAVNITENKDSFSLSIAVPGMKKEDLEIDIEGNLLTISAEKEESKEKKEDKFTREEYNYSCFSRTFTLPDEVKKEKIDAEYKDGILSITLPKTEEARKLAPGRHIAIK